MQRTNLTRSLGKRTWTLFNARHLVVFFFEESSSNGNSIFYFYFCDFVMSCETLFLNSNWFLFSSRIISQVKLELQCAPWVVAASQKRCDQTELLHSVFGAGVILKCGMLPVLWDQSCVNRCWTTLQKPVTSVEYAHRDPRTTFYQRLRNKPPEKRDLLEIQLDRISKTNDTKVRVFIPWRSATTRDRWWSKWLCFKKSRLYFKWFEMEDLIIHRRNKSLTLTKWLKSQLV